MHLEKQEEKDGEEENDSSLDFYLVVLYLVPSLRKRPGPCTVTRPMMMHMYRYLDMTE